MVCVKENIQDKINSLDIKATYATTTAASSGRFLPVVNISCISFNQIDNAVNAPPSDILHDNQALVSHNSLKMKMHKTITFWRLRY